MKKEIHQSTERGTGNLGWLHTRFSFSFADYHNPKRMGFGKLRVFNDDIIEPGTGFGSHPHRNMEIISIPTEGALSHKDSTGIEEVVFPGEVQVMSAGSGITHSEYNHSETEQVKLFQIWIETKEKNIEPRHAKKLFYLNKNSLQLVASGIKNEPSLYIHQDAKIWLGKFDSNKEIYYKMDADHGTFVLVIEGKIDVEGEKIARRDSIEMSGTDHITIKMIEESYLMLIEVPMK